MNIVENHTVCLSCLQRSTYSENETLVKCFFQQLCQFLSFLIVWQVALLVCSMIVLSILDPSRDVVLDLDSVHIFVSCANLLDSALLESSRWLRRLLLPVSLFALRAHKPPLLDAVRHAFSVKVMITWYRDILGLFGQFLTAKGACLIFLYDLQLRELQDLQFAQRAFAGFLLQDLQPEEQLLISEGLQKHESN